MAVLSKIRQRSLLLILVIGFCLFAFIVQDLFRKGGFGGNSKNVGSINGKDVAFEDFRVKVSNAEKNGQNGRGTTQTQASTDVWNREVYTALLNEQFDKLGIRVSKKHILQYLENSPIGQNQMFKNAAGKFDEAKFYEYFKTIGQPNLLADVMKDAEFEAKNTIYTAMVSGGSFTTDMEGKMRYQMETDKVSFDFVAAPYSSIKDSEVKVTDDEIVAYMKDHEKKFKSEELRELEYVTLAEKPSAKDQEEIKTNITALLSPRTVYNEETKKNDTLPGFANATNIPEFVGENSDVPYDSTYVSKKDLPADAAAGLESTPVGGIYGPFILGNYYCLSKVMDKKPNYNAKVSHILISYEGVDRVQKKEKRTKEEAKIKAEMLLAQAKANPGSFMMLALTNSDDSSAQQGGDLGYITPKTNFVKPFKDFVFANPTGTIGLVESEFGYHIINITDKQDGIRLATIAKKIQPSDETNNEMYTKAVKFEMDANEKDFDKTAKAAGLTVNPAVKVLAMDESFGSVQNQRQIVKWAYDKETKVGDVKRFEVPNIGNIIVKLKKVYEKGLKPVDDARAMVEPILKNKKKAERLKAKMTGSSIDAIAKSVNVAVQTATDVTLMNPALPNIGGEPKVVGTAFGTAADKTSAPIEGNSGMYVVRTKSVAKAPVLKDLADYVNKVKAQRSNDANRVFGALKEGADIKDNRADFN